MQDVSEQQLEITPLLSSLKIGLKISDTVLCYHLLVHIKLNL